MNKGMNKWISRGYNSALDIPNSVFPTMLFSFKKRKKKTPLILKYNESLIKEVLNDLMYEHLLLDLPYCKKRGSNLCPWSYSRS